MALDETKDSDKIYDIDGFTYIIDKEFLDKIKPVKVDFQGYGFKLTANIDFGAGKESGCSGCGTTCS